MISLLSMEPQPDVKEQMETDLPAFFQDLNLDQILDQVTEDWDPKVRGLYHVFPKSREEEAYRREIFCDVKKDAVYSALMEFQRDLRDWNASVEQREKAEDALQKHVWYLREVEGFLSGMENLKSRLEQAGVTSRGMKNLLQFLEETLSEKECLALRKETGELWKELSGFRLLLTYEKERYTVTEGTGEGKYEEFLTATFPEKDRSMRSPFLAEEGFSNLEAEIIRMFRKKHKEFFVSAEKFYKSRKPYVNQDVLRLQTETGYYLAYAKFLRKMQERGWAFCTPKPSEDQLLAKGLYDLALALVSESEGREVISNDAELLRDEDFFVLTGPNQGGKTTYARSLGQMIYFAKMGLDVPAASASIPYYRVLWTHFSVEESAETGRGKLMDELVRLKPMMGQGQEEAFIVINELFTTAANYDANVMGKRVLEYFINKQCKGIYVTHLSELSKACQSVVSLRAGVDDRGKRTYVIRRGEARELSGAGVQVDKYGLTYRQLKERFS